MRLPLTKKSVRIGVSDTALEKEVVKLKEQLKESGKVIEDLMAENKRLLERAIHWRGKYNECVEMSIQKEFHDKDQRA